MFSQLGLTPQLSFSPDGAKIHLKRKIGSTIESLVLPRVMPCAQLMRIALEFHVNGELEDVRALVPLVDVALRSFWADKVAALAPTLGRVDFLNGVEERAGYVPLITDVLAPFCGGRQACEAQVWRVMLENLKGGRALEVFGVDVDIKGAQNEAEAKSDAEPLMDADKNEDECRLGEDEERHLADNKYLLRLDEYIDNNFLLEEEDDYIWDEEEDGYLLDDESHSRGFPGEFLSSASSENSELWESLEDHPTLRSSLEKGGADVSMVASEDKLMSASEGELMSASEDELMVPDQDKDSYGMSV